MRLRIISLTFLCSFLSSLLLSSCRQIPISVFAQTDLNYPKAEVLFEVNIPSPVDENTKIVVELLDDVTGLAYNPTRFEMQKQDDRTYFLKTSLVVGSTIKYRYLKENETATVEYTPQGSPVRFRLSQVDGPKVVKDIIAAWVDQPYSGSIGRIRGQFTDVADNSPIPNLLVTAEGVQTVTSSDGSFILEGLTPGTHNLTVMSLDGKYKIFEQGAVVADEATTPVFVSLTKADMVKIKFEVKLPENINSLIPLKIATNSYILGNSFSDDYAGTTNRAMNLPALEQNALGRYEIELSLPVGSDFRYKFTFGDGFWNGELTSTGGFVERQLIVPENDTTVHCIVDSFNPAGTGPITFNVTVPVGTPSEDSIDLQLNPFDWMSPLPMVRVDNVNWTFTLYNPQYFFPTMQYRYCRNGECKFANDTTETGKLHELTITAASQTIADSINQWAYLTPASSPTTVTTEDGNSSPRSDFLTGYEFTADFNRDEIPYLSATFKLLSDSGAKWVILDPTWTATRTNPPLLEAEIGNDLQWNDLLTASQQAKASSLNIGIYPRINFGTTADDYFMAAKKDAGWWQSWFERYHRFMIQNADLANVTGASAIFIGSPDLVPTMTGGKLKDGSDSGAPADADDQWRQLIQDIRSRFSGAVIGVISLPSASDSYPSWLDNVDAVYVQLSPNIDAQYVTEMSDLYNWFNQYLDETLKPAQENLNKPIILGISVPSQTNGNEGCVDHNGSCDESMSADAMNENIDLNLQAKIYNAAVMTSASRDWIKGFVSRDYQPVTSLQDSSSSVRGKPAADVLWYWYRFIGNISQ